MKSLLIAVSFFVILSGCGSQAGQNSKPTRQPEAVQENSAAKDYPAGTLPYEVLTAEMLDTVSDENIHWMVYENLISKIMRNQDKHLEIVKSFSRERQAVYLINNMEIQFGNLGLNNYYWNLKGHLLARLLPSAFETIGAMQCAGVITEANGMFDRNEKRIMELKDQTAEGMLTYMNEFPMKEMNQKLTAAYISDDVPVRLVKFIRAHKSAFIDK